MSRKQHIQALDKMLRDINDSELTFGGKVVVFCGDFHQVLPVVRKGTRQEHVDTRNINPLEGLCNGTRLICQAFDQNVIDAKIAVGHHNGKRVFIPRIPFLPNVDENSGFAFKRTQGQLYVALSRAKTASTVRF
ncbi:hypothetical protein I3843_02G069800 [Carya illinoinensis]|nr:hypothetical protein I3843_02G069800 [Carya illinoinensis]